MTLRADRRIRYALVLLLLCAVVVGQAAALTSAHEQHRAQDPGCLVCYAGALPFLESTTGAPVVPVLCIAWLAAAPHFESFHDVFLAASSSRGPPSQS